MLNMVIDRLRGFGIEPTAADMFILKYLLEKVKNQAKAECNLLELPKELYHQLVDVVVGNFFIEKKAFDPDSLLNIDLERVVKQIQEGDTNITFSDASKTPEQRFDELIRLLAYKEIDYSCYRRIRW